ncbi:hypothetical protein B0H13DRAFT_2405225 [Mycena leptocephala]|nr:hypothetical protein B0H13DRAFT_2405225 [Mycena leptocephala]
MEETREEAMEMRRRGGGGSGREWNKLPSRSRRRFCSVDMYALAAWCVAQQAVAVRSGGDRIRRCEWQKNISSWTTVVTNCSRGRETHRRCEAAREMEMEKERKGVIAKTDNARGHPDDLLVLRKFLGEVEHTSRYEAGGIDLRADIGEKPVSSWGGLISSKHASKRGITAER